MELLGDAVATRIPNTTAVEPASVVDVDAQVREVMFAPSVVSPEVTAIVQSVPVDVSRSNLVVQSGLTSADIAAANVVRSLP